MEMTHDLEMNFNKIAPFGKEDTAKELQDHAAKTQDTLIDAVENAEVAEIKRAVFRALTRLRAPPSRNLTPLLVWKRRLSMPTMMHTITVLKTPWRTFTRMRRQLRLTSSSRSTFDQNIVTENKRTVQERQTPDHCLDIPTLSFKM